MEKKLGCGKTGSRIIAPPVIQNLMPDLNWKDVLQNVIGIKELDTSVVTPFASAHYHAPGARGTVTDYNHYFFTSAPLSSLRLLLITHNNDLAADVTR